MSDRLKLLVVKVNAAAQRAALITIERKPQAIMRIVGDNEKLAGKDLPAVNGRVLRLVCNSMPATDAMRWRFDGIDGVIAGDAVFVGFDPLLRPGVTSVSVDAQYIMERIEWDPARE